MKYKDIPPIGAEIRVLWIDSGLTNENAAGLTPEDMTATHDHIRGVVLKRTPKEIVIGMRTAKSGPEPMNDMYFLCTLKNIEECDLMIPLAVIEKVLGAEAAERVKQYTLEQIAQDKKK